MCAEISSANVADDETLSAIRSVLTEPMEAVAPVPKIKREPSMRVVVDPVAPAVEPATPEFISKPSMFSRLRLPLRMPSYRPSPKHLAWAAIAVAVVMRPHVFVIGFVLLLMVFGACFALFGADAVWGAVMRRFAWFAQKYPARAARFATRMDAIALRWDSFLDRFPDGTVDGLYLPDFQSFNAAEERHAAAMDARLSRLQASVEAGAQP